MLYLWVKAAHIIFVIALMAGLLVYPRYKIHQLSSAPGEVLFETMQEASKRLQRVILNPSLLLTWALGLLMLALNPALLERPWMWAKLALVLALSALYGYFAALGKKIDRAEAVMPAGRLRLMNELPFILMVGVVILVILKPA